MKVLLDSCVSGAVRKVLEDAGHDAAWAGNWPRDPGDKEILATAHAEGRILVTIDKDFGKLAVLRRAPHSGILRLADQPVSQQAVVCLRVLRSHGRELAAGAILTAQPGRWRLRPPESE